jgi:uncharacterized protein (TIGR01244 family)
VLGTIKEFFEYWWVRKIMDMVREITNELAIAGQLTIDDLQPLANRGYRSVVNLRSPDEPDCLEAEQQKIEALGLSYINLPIQAADLNCDAMTAVIQSISELPKPALVHCDNGIRASIVVLMKIAIEQGVNAEDAFHKVKELGWHSNP